MVYTYRFPEQETKLKTGDNGSCVQTSCSVSDLDINESTRTVSFRYAIRNGAPGDEISIGPGRPISSKKITAALFRYADSVIEGNGRYAATRALLEKRAPRINGLAPGAVIIDESSDPLEQTIRAVSNLQDSVLFIQGPPGTGKTYTAAHVIAALLSEGHRVGVTSNSHKAINNLLGAVENVAVTNNQTFHGAKKSTRGKEGSEFGGRFIQDVFTNDEVIY